MNKIGIVIVTYNRINLLKKCIECAKKQRNVDILVIDNASTDGTDKLFYKKDDHCVSYYNTGKNLGGAGGFNFGIKKAVEKKYEYILVMDDDTILQDNTIAELRKVINSIDDFSFLACKVLWKDGNLCLMNRPKISNNVLNYHKYIDEGVICVDSSSFVGCLLNTKYIKNVGYPISDFFIWGDDVEYTTRLSTKAPGFFVSNAIVIHECANNDSINIYNELNFDRISRYKFLYRNRMYNLRKKGIKGMIRYFLLLIRDILLVLFKGKYKIRKIIIIMKGCILGLFFYPRIEK